MRSIPFHKEMLNAITSCPTRSVIVIKDPSIVNFYDALENAKILIPSLDLLNVTKEELLEYDYVIIEDAEQIVGHPLLYTILNEIQYTQCTIILSTCQIDLLDSFEKRIKSRFNNSVINLFDFYSTKSGSDLVHELLLGMNASNEILQLLTINKSKIDENWTNCQLFGILKAIADLLMLQLPIDPILPNRSDISKLSQMERHLLLVCIDQNEQHPYITAKLIFKNLKKQFQFSDLVVQQRMDHLCEMGFLVPCELNWKTTTLPRAFQPFICIASPYDKAALENYKDKLIMAPKDEELIFASIAMEE